MEKMGPGELAAKKIASKHLLKSEDYALTQLANAWLDLAVLPQDAKDAETLANLVVCSLHLGKSPSRYLSQLKLTHPDHLLVKRQSTAEESFDRAVQTMA
ncbi:hypothetical protein MRB53_026467 [Persea americana]|uniref:Uncharacterized protein n=1 Tax=Persea americana TaxID=3435 RepID=A0ACC2LI50_PERAE|nr:hypothetical protein MRB53_026467 [Persea americana]